MKKCVGSPNAVIDIEGEKMEKTWEMIKAEVKGYTRTRRGQMERVSPYSRLFEKPSKTMSRAEARAEYELRDKISDLVKEKGLSVQTIGPFAGGTGWYVTIDSKDYVVEGKFGTKGFQDLQLTPRDQFRHYQMASGGGVIKLGETAEAGGKIATGKEYFLRAGAVRRLKPGTNIDEYKAKYPDAKKVGKPPSIKTMQKWSFDGIAKATDGCKVEPDGICQHGHKSWLLVLGYI